MLMCVPPSRQEPPLTYFQAVMLGNHDPFCDFFQRMFESERVSLLSCLLIPILLFFRAFHFKLPLSPSACIHLPLFFIFSFILLYFSEETVFLWGSAPSPQPPSSFSQSLRLFRCAFARLFISPLFLSPSFLLWWRGLIMWGWAVFAPHAVCGQGQLWPSLSEQGATDVERQAERLSGKKINRLVPQKWFDLPLVWKCAQCPNLTLLFLLQCHPYFYKILVWELYSKQPCI